MNESSSAVGEFELEDIISHGLFEMVSLDAGAIRCEKSCDDWYVCIG